MKKTIDRNLLQIISKPETLLLPYWDIQGNKGAFTQCQRLKKDKIEKMTTEQKELYFRSLTFLDKFSLYDGIWTTELLKKGLYQCGSSKKLYFPKPRMKDKMRPIPIPLFLDKGVQKPICMVLESIYEPYFEKQIIWFQTEHNIRSARCNSNIHYFFQK